MTTGQRALCLISGNVILTFLLTLLARNLLINPDLLAIEQAADRKDIARFEQSIDRYRNILEGRIRRIYSAAGLLEGLDSGIQWQPLVHPLAEIGGYEDLDYYILSNNTGEISELHAGELAVRTKSYPGPAVKPEILEHVLPRLRGATGSTISGLYLSTSDGPLAYAAGKSTWRNKNLPSVYIAVRRLNATLIHEFTERLGLVTELVPAQTFNKEISDSQTKPGQRDEQDAFYTVLYGDDAQAVLHLKFQAAPRAFDDKPFSPTIWVGMLIAAGSWSLVFIYVYYRTVTPLRRITRTLQLIRQTNNFNKHLVYKPKDEFGKLVNECNELLKHISQHTEKLESYSYEDALTGLGNRRHFQEKLQNHFSIAKRKNLLVSAIVFDLDNFKQYNDTYGHDGGDEVLRQFANILKQSFTRELDVVARTGGEEFIVLILDVSASDSLRLANRVVERLFELNIPHQANHAEGRVTVSAGVATGYINKEPSLEPIIIHADAALYKAKQQGRNRSCQHQNDSTGEP